MFTLNNKGYAPNTIILLRVKCYFGALDSAIRSRPKFENCKKGMNFDVL